MTVELDVFSGRANPRWNLTQAEADHVTQLLRGLPPTDEEATPGLGYRGFVLIDGQRRLSVGGAVVRIEEGASTQTYRDENGLESYLQDLARGRGYGELIGTERR